MVLYPFSDIERTVLNRSGSPKAFFKTGFVKGVLKCLDKVGGVVSIEVWSTVGTWDRESLSADDDWGVALGATLSVGWSVAWGVCHDW